MKSLMISADSHVTEPPNTYIDNIDPAYRDRAPKMIDHEKLGDVFVIDGMSKPISLVDRRRRGQASRGDQVVRRRSSTSCIRVGGIRTPAWPIRCATASPPRSSTRPSG